MKPSKETLSKIKISGFEAFGNGLHAPAQCEKFMGAVERSGAKAGDGIGSALCDAWKSGWHEAREENNKKLFPEMYI